MYAGYDKNIITIKEIEENKSNAGVCENAIVLNIIYLGYMTKEELNNETKNRVFNK